MSSKFNDITDNKAVKIAKVVAKTGTVTTGVTTGIATGASYLGCPPCNDYCFYKSPFNTVMLKQ
jgi:hypothetical protein